MRQRKLWGAQAYNGEKPERRVSECRADSDAIDGGPALVGVRAVVVCRASYCDRLRGPSGNPRVAATDGPGHCEVLRASLESRQSASIARGRGLSARISLSWVS